jgi:predicted nuclease of predicted toxin-antitoxin system
MKKLLLDQDVYGITEKFLLSCNHDVILVSQLGLSQASDEEILIIAQKQNRILITRDRDFGNLVFVKKCGSGVIYLRGELTKMDDIHRELNHVLQKYSQTELKEAFIVVQENGHRFRKIT